MGRSSHHLLLTRRSTLSRLSYNLASMAANDNRLPSSHVFEINTRFDQSPLGNLNNFSFPSLILN
ncbi:hypothetical protein RchiOBHm_Chr6g0262161 [Rosa chinensis]|uniref:Uncharacterized protein n=1 Tax=Rosa chinensis TaxID=74649 RepID=A0A2P6PNK1_ROSCH|nr:hypothetical protein RchiOBHm_Chr6g0262161 [Rosa chinensis]